VAQEAVERSLGHGSETRSGVGEDLLSVAERTPAAKAGLMLVDLWHDWNVVPFPIWWVAGDFPQPVSEAPLSGE